MADKKKKKARVVDKWKTKNWYTVVAPDMFENKEMGHVVAADESSLQNRVVKANLTELTGQFSQAGAYTTLSFRIDDVKGKQAKTRFVGHALSPAYIRTLARRRRSVINEVEDVLSKDGIGVRLKMVVITAFRSSASIKTALRKMVREEAEALAKSTDFQQLAQEIIFGKFSRRILAKVKKIAPVSRVEVKKAEVKEIFS